MRPPKGIGSLGIRTGSGQDKAAFGNQVDWVDALLSTINTVKYSVFTTGENIAGGGPTNLPNLQFEVNPQLPGDNYATLLYAPVEAAPGWSEQDASSAERWYFTGDTGTSTGCNEVTYCTLAAAKAAAPDATLLTVQITHGRNWAFSGAVDALQINNVVYDFEPFGVSETTP